APKAKAPQKAEAQQKDPEVTSEAPAKQPAGDGRAEQRAPASTQPAATPPAARADGERFFASPLARRLAKEAGIDLAAVSGSGPRGRVVKADVETAIEKGVAPAAKAPE